VRVVTQGAPENIGGRPRPGPAEELTAPPDSLVPGWGERERKGWEREWAVRKEGGKEGTPRNSSVRGRERRGGKRDGV